MASIEGFQVSLVGGGPWGFRLQGGKDFRAPLKIAKVESNSKAELANLTPNLYVLAINNQRCDDMTHSDALNAVKRTGQHLDLLVSRLPESNKAYAPQSSGYYTTEDINQGSQVSRATFRPAQEVPAYATLPRGQLYKGEVDENYNTAFANVDHNRNEWDPNMISDLTRTPQPIKLLHSDESVRAVSTNPDYAAPTHVRVPDDARGFTDKPRPIGRGGRRFDESSQEYYPQLTSGSIGSEEDYPNAVPNGDVTNYGQPGVGVARPAMSQFRKQKNEAEMEAFREPKPIKKVPPPPPAKPERKYIGQHMEQIGPHRPAIKRGGKWYKEMFKEMHSSAGTSSNLTALLASDAARSEGPDVATDMLDRGDADILGRPKNQAPGEEYIHPADLPGIQSAPKPTWAGSPGPQRKPSGSQGGTPAWYQEVHRGQEVHEEPTSYGVHRKQPSYDSGDELTRINFAQPRAPQVHGNKPVSYEPPLARSAADRRQQIGQSPVTIQQEMSAKPPSASSLYESRFYRGGGSGGPPERNRSASEELNVKYQPPSDEELIREREEEARRRREEEQRMRMEEEARIMRMEEEARMRREMEEMRRQQEEERRRREREAEMLRRRQEEADAARKLAERPQFFAMALYNFNAQSPKELSFKKGDYIIVKRQIDRNWIEGEVGGRIGIFPTNYVELRPIEDEEQEESPPSPYIPVSGEASVRYAFKAESPRELSVAKGEFVTLNRKVDANWYEATVGNKKGIIPSQYLEVVREPNVVPKASLSPKERSPPSQTPLSTQQRQPARVEQPYQAQKPKRDEEITEITRTTTTTTYDAKTNPKDTYGEPIRVPQASRPQPQVKYVAEKQPEPAIVPASAVTDEHEIQMPFMEGERYKAAYGYSPQNEDELPLAEGEEVYVLEKCDDGWFVGHSIRTGLFGTFPGNYVVPLCK